ncbi:MAG: ATP synthase F1 subunit epsilon [Lachnospiraceae bacterium]|nr:ATP synthase F1 subunit epsilon [Lachnospiraceae bacterium]
MAENVFQLKIVTPERVFFDEPVQMVEFNTTEGEVGIYANHVPITLIISPGVLRITTAEGEKKAALHAGFVEVLPDKVTILAEIIEWPDEIDEERATEAERRARERIAARQDGVDLDRAEISLKKAIARINALR